MNHLLNQDIQEIMSSTNFKPVITIILPFQPKINLKTELSHQLKLAADKVEKQILQHYGADAVITVMPKLRNLIDSLNYDTQKKSIAIYVSPLFEKVIYLDIPVEERIIVGDTFEIRELVYAKKELHNYLVLLLSYNESQLYLGNSTTLVRTVSNPAEATRNLPHDLPEKVANFSDQSERKEIEMDKFLQQIDNNLDKLLNAYRLPLFVIGTKRIAGHFKKLTRHSSAVISFIHGNYQTASTDELKELLEPYIRDWISVKNKEILNRVEEAYEKNKLAFGMKNVWQESMNNKGSLLVIEKNFHYPDLLGNKENIIHPVTDQPDSFSFDHDTVDKTIAKILESGGDIEFVDTNVLEKYDHIALIQYY